MGRKNENARLEVFKVRSKNGPKSSRKFNTQLVLSSSSMSDRLGSKTLHVGKISLEKIQKTGEYNPLPRKLMEEFRESRESIPNIV